MLHEMVDIHFENMLSSGTVVLISRRERERGERERERERERGREGGRERERCIHAVVQRTSFS